MINMRKAEASILVVIALGLLITLLAEVSYGGSSEPIDSNTTKQVNDKK